MATWDVSHGFQKLNQYPLVTDDADLSVIEKFVRNNVQREPHCWWGWWGKTTRQVLWCHCTYKVIPCAARETWYIPSCLYLGPSNHMSNAYREPCLLGTEPSRHVVWTTLRPIAQSCPQLTKRLNIVEDANAHWSTLCLLWIGLYLIYAWQLSVWFDVLYS